MATRGGIARRSKAGARKKTAAGGLTTRKGTRDRTWTGGRTGKAAPAVARTRSEEEPRTKRGVNGDARRIGGATTDEADRHGVRSRSRHKFKTGGGNKNRRRSAEPARSGPRRTAHGERVGSGERPVRGRT